MKASIKEVLKNTDLSQNKALNELVYEALRKTIIEGKFPVGERINEKEYAGAMNISRTPIRYALKMLEQEGLVEYIPNVGVVVNQITIKDCYEVYAIRKALESVVAITAMHQMTEADFLELDELLNLTMKKHEMGQVEEVIDLFATFHQFIYEKSDMQRIKDVVMRIHEYSRRFRGLCLGTNSRREQAIKDHRLIYDAMTCKDEARVKRLIDQHLNESLAFSLDRMHQEETKIKIR